MMESHTARDSLELVADGTRRRPPTGSSRRGGTTRCSDCWPPSSSSATPSAARPSGSPASWSTCSASRVLVRAYRAHDGDVDLRPAARPRPAVGDRDRRAVRRLHDRRDRRRTTSPATGGPPPSRRPSRLAGAIVLGRRFDDRPARGAAGRAMTAPPEAGLDETIHAPHRLRICAFLASTDEAEFGTLRDLLGVSDSVTSKHLKVLEQAGYAKVSKPTGHGRVADLGVAHARPGDAPSPRTSTPCAGSPAAERQSAASSAVELGHDVAVELDGRLGVVRRRAHRHERDGAAGRERDLRAAGRPGRPRARSRRRAARRRRPPARTRGPAPPRAAARRTARRRA